MDVASKVSGQVQVINARQNAPHNPAELDIAARNEEEKVIQGQGTLIQKDAAPKSYTSFQEKMPGLWAAGLTKNPLSAGWYAPAGGEQSGFGPDQVKTQSIAEARRAGDFLGAAAQGYDALTGSGGDLSKLSTNEGAVRMAIDLALDSAKAFSVEQTALPVLRAAAARVEDAVNSILGIDPDAAKQILPQVLFTTTVQGDIKNQASGTVGLVSAILRLGESALKMVTDHVLGQAPTLQTVQNMFHILRLRDMEKGTKSEASEAAEAALKKTAGKTLQTAAAQTGHEELDDLTGIANQSSHNLDAVMKRWGMQGVNYIGNLLKAGRGDLAAAITAMPTYAKSAIVAETNMRTFGLNDAAIAAQENALAVDMKSPIVVFSAKQIAKQQAVEARKAELTAGGGLLVQSILVQKVNEAGKTVNHSKLALDQAVRNEQTGRDALTKAQALFHKNMADTAAADTVVAAIDNLQKATDARAKVQKAHKQNQQSLNDAQQKLTDTQKQAAAGVDERAKQDVDDMRLKLQEVRTKLVGKALSGEQGDLLPGKNQILDIQNVTPYGSLYHGGKSLHTNNDPRNGNSQPTLQSVDLFSNRVSLLAKSMGSGIMETKGAGGGGSGLEEGKNPTPVELIAALTTSERLPILKEISNQCWGLLTDEQKQRIDHGESMAFVLSELDPGKQEQIEKWGQTILSFLDEQQKKDFLFLGSGLLDGLNLNTRQAILNRIKENDGKITIDDLVEIGVYEPGTLSENVFDRLLQNIGGRPEFFADELGYEYQRISDFGLNLGQLDQAFRSQFEAQRTMAVIWMLAPLMFPKDSLYHSNNRQDNNGEQESTKDISYDTNSRLDNIERQGWDIKGPQSNMKPSEVVGNPDEPTKGTGEYSGKPFSGTRNPDADFTNKSGNSTLKIHFDDHVNEFKFTTEDEYLLGAKDFLEKQPTPTTQSFLTKDGTYFRYDTETNEFGIMNKFGGISTYFKPDRGIDYWLEQIKLYAPRVGKG